ncbi:hypothetical protein KSP40_PGU006158 [Platanthera guangdongensis]|uniref:Uncharacterized protein n=1 Tax=Platanthera guangdongensis TaxID=2320717 RepID=A0ABR2N3F5_9ASPA
MDTRKVDNGTVSYLEKIGLLGSNLLAAHSVWVNEDEVSIITSLKVDEMYLASLINKGKEAYTKGTTNPTALPAEVVLKMTTIFGAKSVLWDNEIGSIEVGKKQDPSERDIISLAYLHQPPLLTMLPYLTHVGAAEPEAGPHILIPSLSNTGMRLSQAKTDALTTESYSYYHVPLTSSKTLPQIDIFPFYHYYLV